MAEVAAPAAAPVTEAEVIQERFLPAEELRLQGNEAFKGGALDKAAVLYTQAIDAVPADDASAEEIEVYSKLHILYSNRCVGSPLIPQASLAAKTNLLAAANLCGMRTGRLHFLMTRPHQLPSQQ